MDFCTQCGNALETNARFCGKCGVEIKRQELNQSPEALHNNSSVSSENINNYPNKKGDIPNKQKSKYNRNVIAVLTIVSVFIIFYMVSPKQLTVQEYEDLAIELLVKDRLAMDDFSNEIDYSGIYIGFEPDWTEEYKQLVKPAKDLEKDFEQLSKRLEDIKPPEYFEYEHENLLKVFNAHKNMASNISSYMAKGEERHMELSEEYESRADDYFEESIFLTDEYEERLTEAYRMITTD